MISLVFGLVSWWLLRINFRFDFSWSFSCFLLDFPILLRNLWLQLLFTTDVLVVLRLFVMIRQFLVLNRRVAALFERSISPVVGSVRPFTTFVGASTVSRRRSSGPRS